MTDLEVTDFVEKEIAARYKTLPDATRGDWVRAIRKADSIDTARKIVREIVDDPETTLCVKAFYKLLKARGGNGRPEGKATFLCREDAPFDVFAVATGPDGRVLWHMRLNYPTHLRYENGVVDSISWTAEKLMDGMQRTLREIRAVYGGEWWLEVKNPAPEPAPEIGKRALGLRILAAGLGDKLQAPAEEPPDGRKVKDMIEAMKAADAKSEGGFVERIQGQERPKGKLPEKVSGHPFNPEHDEELRGDL